MTDGDDGFDWEGIEVTDTPTPDAAPRTIGETTMENALGCGARNIMLTEFERAKVECEAHDALRKLASHDAALRAALAEAERKLAHERTLNESFTQKSTRALNESMSANAALTARVAALEGALADANSLCRSAFQIASRQGQETNWGAFTDRLYESLVRQHQMMYPNAKCVVDEGDAFSGEAP